MELRILDENFSAIAIMDTFESVIWSDRYYGAGDFDITTYATSNVVAYLNLGRYLELAESDKIMIIEDYWVHTDRTSGNTVIVKGRSLESILDRRIIWPQTILNGNFQDAIEQLLNENAIAPTDPNRAIDLLLFEASTNPDITNLTVSAQFIGDNLYTTIHDLCYAANVGFKITKNADGNLVFNLYSGADRSYEQLVNPYVVFSPEYDNLVNSDYKAYDTELKNVAYVGGEGEGSDRKSAIVDLDEETDLARREMFVNASYISSTVDGGTLTPEEYTEELEQKGYEELAKAVFVQLFEGQVNSSSRSFVYGEDFFLGDIVQVENEYGHQGRSRVTEIIRVQNSSGLNVYPTFVTVV